MYLRISFELYLKRLLVGNLEKVYEIGRDFRNEGVSYKHNPEFTQLEFYWAYADYLQVMELTEQMVSYAAKEVTGGYKVIYQGNEIDFTPPWRRLEMRQGILETSGIDIDEYKDAESLFKAIVTKHKDHTPDPVATRGKLIDYLLSEFLEPTLIQPTFLYDYPRDISPLAKSKPGDPLTVERFEGYVSGFELCNAFTELNDPLDQEQRFLEMGRDYEVDDEERHPLDEDYLRAMRYGMPPNGGFGMGVDRLAMVFTDKHSIREVLLFPALRKEEKRVSPHRAGNILPCVFTSKRSSKMSGISTNQEQQIRELISDGNKIAAIKLYRETTNLGLKESKDAVEAMERGKAVNFPAPAQVGELDPFLENRIKRLLSERKKIEAVKIYREAYNCGLKDAKDAVDIIQAEMRKEGYTSMPSTPTISDDPFAEDAIGNRARLIVFVVLAILICLGGLFFFMQSGF